MLNPVQVNPKSIEAYREPAGDAVVDEILRLAEPLKGARVLHVNATAFGGGVAEILYTLTALMQDVGVKADWQVIDGSDQFFNTTKCMHNGLQGMEVPFTDTMTDEWIRINQENADRMELDYDYYIIHDPQPVGLIKYINEKARSAKWIWRCHIDTTQSFQPIWDFMHPYADEYDATIFTMPEYDPGGKAPVRVNFPPCIDPLSPKNIEMSPALAREVLSNFDLDLDRPIITQISRFDPWKDPLGVIEAYKIVKAQRPDVQLALVGSMASDDPEGWHYYNKTKAAAGDDSDIHILTNFEGVGNTEVNAFQGGSDVVLQKSVREGFGLTVSEALWKGRPVIAGNCGGIKMQIKNGENGYLVDSIEECADRILELLKNPENSLKMGAEGREHVRDNFLTTRNLIDYLTLLGRLKDD